MRISSQEVDRQAAEWATRMAAGELSPDELAALEVWLGADVRHPGAYGRAEAVLVRLDKFRGVGSDALRSAPPVRRWSRRTILTSAGGAAGFAAAASIAGVVLWGGSSGKAYVTGIGETKVIALADGSIVNLNSNSMMSVAFSRELRKVDLLRGEALFNVAKDKERPFVVLAGDTQVRAVGTSFAVRLQMERPTEVLVQEGVVEVSRRNAENATPVRAKADTKTVVPVNAPIATEAVTYTQIARKLAWQYGQIAFDNETLADAAREFARYSSTKIVVEPSVAGQTVTGAFAANDPVGFAKAATGALELRMEVRSGEVWIGR
jgi:transmembrane sensor